MMKVRFEMARNDLIWSFVDSDGKRHVWWGYNDKNWWCNVAETDTFQVRGKFRLNPHTDEVTEVEGE